MGITRPPIVIGLIAVGIFAVLGLLCINFTHLGGAGLAFCAAVAVTVMSGLLWLGLDWRIGGLLDHRTIETLVKALAIAIVAYFVTLHAQKFATTMLAPFDAHSNAVVTRYAARIGILGLGAVAGGATFLVLARILRLEGLTRGRSRSNQSIPPQ
jgi:peptidoglycan biosynthesis protein MviN/MurJ (putative lipid II flippase)